MADFIAASAAVLMVPSIEGFKERLNAKLKEVDAHVDVGVNLKDKDLEKALAEIEIFKKAAEEDKITLGIKADFRDATNSITEIRHKYQDLKGEWSKAISLVLKVEGLSLLPQLGSALGAVDESVVQLSQSLLLVPGIVAGVASVFGTLAVGLSGVKAAFTAYGTAQKDSAQDATRAKDATRELTNANRDLDHALKDAKRSQEDLNAQLRDAPLDEASAEIDLQQARIDAAQRFGKTALQQQRDALAVDKAEANLANTRTRNTRLVQDAAEANAKGVAGNPAVLDALDRQTKAQEGLNNASKGGTAIQEALKNVAPNTADFVTKVESMRGAWTGFKNSVGDNLFAGLGDEAVGLGAKLPVVQKGFDGIATSLNGNIKAAIKSVGSEGAGGNVSFFERIFGNTVGADKILSAGIDPLISGFTRLAAVGSDFLPRLASGFDALANRFNSFITKADRDGSLKTWIDGGLKALDELGSSAVNIGKILKDVSDIFGGTGGKSFLSELQDGTKRLDTFLKSSNGKEELRTFFIETREELAKWKPILDDLPKLVGNFKDAVIGDGGVFLPVLTKVSSLLASYPALMNLVVDGFIAWKTTIGPIIKTIGFLMGDSGLLKTIKLVIRTVGEEGLVGSFSKLAALITPGGLVFAAVAAIGILIGGAYLSSQQKAAQAAKDHADQLKRINDELDYMSGAVTRATQEQQLKDAHAFKNPVTGETVDIPAAATRAGVPTADVLNSFDPKQQGTRDATDEKLTQIAKSGIEGNAQTKALVALLAKQNFSSDDIVKALSGDSAEIDRYNSLTVSQNGRNVKPDIAKLGDAFGGNVRDATNVLQSIRSNSTDNASQGRSLSTDNAVINGTDVINAQGHAQFDQLGNPTATAGDNGGTLIRVDKSIEDIRKNFPQLATDIESNGGSLKPLGSGTQIILDGKRAPLYVDHIPGHAGGGMLQGPGSGTSDSILARVSNGEFITKASQVAKNPALYHALNSGAIDPRSLPHFDGGGGVQVVPRINPPTKYKVVPPPGAPAAPGKEGRDGNSGVPGVKPGSIFDPANTNPGLNSPGAPAAPGAPASGTPLFGTPSTTAQNPLFTQNDPAQPIGVTGAGPLPGPAPGDPALTPPADDGFASQHPFLAQIGQLFGFGGGTKGGAGGADGGGQQNPILSFGQILLDAVLSFFGINPAYLNEGKGLLSGIIGARRGQANGEAQTILDAQGNPVPEAGSPGQQHLPGGAGPVNYAGGAGSSAADRANNMAAQMAGKPYTWGGAGLNGTDCSGLVAYIADAYVGRPFAGRDGGTGTEAQMLTSRGAIIVDDPSKMPAGTLQVGWNGEHTSGTLPNGTSFEAQTFGVPIQVGGTAGGAKEKGFTQWAYFPPAAATGGMFAGPGSGTSDSILARVSNGEFITRASVVKQNPGLFHGLNSGAIDPRSMPHFAVGGGVDLENAFKKNPAGQVNAGANGFGGGPSNTGSNIPKPDTAQRAAAVPGATSTDHVAPGVSEGIQGAVTAIGNAASTAASVASFGAGGGGGGAGALIQGITQIGGSVASGVANIFSSLGIGNITPGTTGSAYGTPVLPQNNNPAPQGPRIVNQYGDIHTASYDEFYKGQQRREQQQQQPLVTTLGK